MYIQTHHLHIHRHTTYMYIQTHHLHVHTDTPPTCTDTPPTFTYRHTTYIYIQTHHLHLHTDTPPTCTYRHITYIYIQTHHLHVHTDTPPTCTDTPPTCTYRHTTYMYIQTHHLHVHTDTPPTFTFKTVFILSTEYIYGRPISYYVLNIIMYNYYNGESMFSERWRLHFKYDIYNQTSGHAVSQLVEALRYKLEGVGFDSQLKHFIDIILSVSLWPWGRLSL
jgi:hypothetical protein